MIVLYCLLVSFSGCIEEKTSAVLPQQHHELELLHYEITTYWLEGDDQQSFQRYNHTGLIHNLANQTNAHTVSYWIECHVHNHHEHDVYPLIIGLSFRNASSTEVHSREFIFEEGLAPKETKWLTVIINKEKEETTYAFDFTTITHIAVVAYTQPGSETP